MEFVFKDVICCILFCIKYDRFFLSELNNYSFHKVFFLFESLILLRITFILWFLSLVTEVFESIHILWTLKCRIIIILLLVQSDCKTIISCIVRDAYHFSRIKIDLPHFELYVCKRLSRGVGFVFSLKDFKNYRSFCLWPIFQMWQKN